MEDTRRWCEAAYSPDEEKMTGSDDPDMVAYQAGEHFVVCDRKNPKAWIRSDTVIVLADDRDGRVSLR